MSVVATDREQAAGASRTGRRRLSGLAIGALGSLAMAASLAGPLLGLGGTGDLADAAAMTVALHGAAESAGCHSDGDLQTCSTLDSYGGTTAPLRAGHPRTTVVVVRNTGSTPLRTAILPGPCAAGRAATATTGTTVVAAARTSGGDLCSALHLDIFRGSPAEGHRVFHGTPAGLARPVHLGAVDVRTSQSFTFVLTLPTTAEAAVQGQQVSQPLTWSTAL